VVCALLSWLASSATNNLAITHQVFLFTLYARYKSAPVEPIKGFQFVGRVRGVGAAGAAFIAGRGLANLDHAPGAAGGPDPAGPGGWQAKPHFLSPWNLI